MANLAKNQKTAPSQETNAPDLEQQVTHEPRQLGAADFRPFFPESSGKCMVLFGANSLSITEDKGFKPSMTIPYSEEWLTIVQQKLVVSISDSFAKVDAPDETFTATKKAIVTVGYLLANSLNGSMERGNTNFYAKQTGKDSKGTTVYGNRTEAGLERIANAMQALDLSPSTFGQEKKATFVFAKFVAWVDEQTKAGGTLNAKADTWAATKKRYPTSRLLEAAILKLHREHGAAYWLTAPIMQAGYVEPAEIEADSLTDLL